MEEGKDVKENLSESSLTEEHDSKCDFEYPVCKLDMNDAEVKEGIKSLCSKSLDEIGIDQKGEINQLSCIPFVMPRLTLSYTTVSPQVPRMWQSLNPEDIKTCAKSTPACRSKYVEVIFLIRADTIPFLFSQNCIFREVRILRALQAYMSMIRKMQTNQKKGF